MFTSIRQVNEEFFKRFYRLRIPIGDEERVIPCRYARKSSRDYVEEQENQIYPCIAIQDYTPRIKDDWYLDMKTYLGDISRDKLVGYLYRNPVWMEFRYDVSIVAKGYNEFIAMQDYFTENFVYNLRFVFNSKLSGEDLVGDVVPYTIRENYIPRNDGVFEINYEFTCSVWVQPEKAQVVDLVQLVRINMQGEEDPLNIFYANEGDFIPSEGGVIIVRDDAHK